ncbi:pyridoxal 5'-phosphate synthase glutaminase subunit PdxT [Corynebacterium mendelii]|uniref:Pyridoxal 5'-phosphate synthase subunit PdxT n=1 Tax=Corynebacterium mendelii TaxID=2765362 RepID=A0A939IWT7_9CORY|nr:pyridoxal 5'-phosphate synthase glutaminase subunit PdxT [Corynebacterium mendelii]MBN9643373.1 pyridoxal 5'-phosphate synthase glutaminase subunit PdxT [Corynebacterium mendelii]
MSPVIGILALQGGVAEHERSLGALGVKSRLVRRREHLTGIDALIFPGGESTTMSKLLVLGGLYEPVKQLLDGGLPAYGTCAGMILLASRVENTRDDAVSFGAIDMTVKRNAFGRQVDSFESDLTVTGIDGKVHAVFIRAPQVIECGADCEVLARVDQGPAAGAIVAVAHNNVLATSFHPEVTDDTRVHELFINRFVGA